MIPVSVLTGFLGSGKTTLLGHLLRQPEFSRTAVIINEFGEVGLDHELVESERGELHRAADRVPVLQGPQRPGADACRTCCGGATQGAVPPFERIVIETSGLADPAPILQTLMTDASIAGRLALGGVVTTVDAVNGRGDARREAIPSSRSRSPTV